MAVCAETGMAATEAREVRMVRYSFSPFPFLWYCGFGMLFDDGKD